MPGQRGSCENGSVTQLLIGCARVSTANQDLASQRAGLTALGVDEKRVYVDHGLTGTNRDRPGLREALAACREGDTLVVTNSTASPARCQTPGTSSTNSTTVASGSTSAAPSTTPPTRSRLLFTVLSMIAEFEADLARARTREGLAVAKAKGRLRGKPPKLKSTQEAHLVKLWQGGEHTTLELAELFSVSRATVYRAIQRGGAGRPDKTT